MITYITFDLSRITTNHAEVTLYPQTTKTVSSMRHCKESRSVYVINYRI